MINPELVTIFEDLADMEEIEGNRWESLAYRRVATSISLLSEDVMELYKRKELRKIEGVGTSIEKKIGEYIETGKIQKHRDLLEKYKVDFSSLRNIQGLGPKRIAALHNALGIGNLDELIQAIRSDRVSKVPGFGLKSQEGLNKAIELFLSSGAGRKPLALCYDDVQSFLEKLRNSGYFTHIEVAGSIRRMKDTIGDIDILASSKRPTEAADYFVSLGDVKHVVAKGETKVSVLLSLGLNCDLRIINEDSFGAALQYFTGSKEHNIQLRDMAIGAGLKLSEYGLFRGSAVVAGRTEGEVYNYLGLELVPPELRENMGEIEAAIKHNLPKLVGSDEIRGDYHTHTDASDGFSTLEEMVDGARKLNYEFLAVTEHSEGLRVAGGLNEERFRKRNSEIDRMNESDNRLKILKGVELEILKDGRLDLSGEILSEMDVVIGALHQGISDDIRANTSRLVKAIESGHIMTVAHPTGRLIGSREPYRIDFDTVFRACHDNDVALEINGYPTRSDLPFDLVKRARSYKVKFTLGSDAHSVEQLKFLRFANAIARRGWLQKEDVLNTRILEKSH